MGAVFSRRQPAPLPTFSAPPPPAPTAQPIPVIPVEWIPPVDRITADDLCALSTRLYSRLESLKANASAALSDLESWRATLADALDGIVDDEERIEAQQVIGARYSELEAKIAHAEATKVAALESELVSLDAALEHIAASDDDGIQALQHGLAAQFGLLPLEPQESGILKLMPTERTELAAGLDRDGGSAVPFLASLGTICAPESVGAACVTVCSSPLPPPLYAWAGCTFRLELAVSSCESDSDDDMRAASEHLAARLRVVAALVPEEATERAADPVPLRATCTPMVGGVAVRIPVPPIASLPPCAWSLRVGRIAVGGESVSLGILAGARLPLRERPLPGPRGPVHSYLYTACKQDNLASVRGLLAQGGASGASTEEAENVSDAGALRLAVQDNAL